MTKGTMHSGSQGGNLTSEASEWKNFWERKSDAAVSDYEFDRGTHPRASEIEELSNRELLEFIGPNPWDVVFDAGCGTGANILILCSRVKRVVGMDYSQGAVRRCGRKVLSNKVENARLVQGDVTCVPLRDRSVDKVLCMSVLQYLNDAQVRRALSEFRRVLRDSGALILHVKNISSFYLSTLWMAKRLKLLLGGKPKLEHFRSFRWYVNELQLSGFQVEVYNSFNLFMVESMPKRLLKFLQKLELRHYEKFPLRTSFMRRRGSDLKMKARPAGRSSGCGGSRP